MRSLTSGAKRGGLGGKKRALKWRPGLKKIGKVEKMVKSELGGGVGGPSWGPSEVEKRNGLSPNEEAKGFKVDGGASGIRD